MISANNTEVKPTSLYSGSAIHLYLVDISHHTGCTSDFLCGLLSFKSNFLDKTTISREELCCKFVPGSYQHHCGKTIKKVSNRISRTVKLRIIYNCFKGILSFYIEKFLPVKC